MKNTFYMTALIVAALIILSGCGGSAAVEADPENHSASMTGHASDDDHQDQMQADSKMMVGHQMTHAHVEAPAEYADLTNPLANDAATLANGKTIYETNCLACHGETGRGDGVAGVALEPQPANLAAGTMMHDLSDGYLFWRISRGGAIAPFNSAMPAWDETLSEAEIWQVISYIRALSR